MAKLVMNTSTRVIHGHYTLAGSTGISTERLDPGLNTVKNTVLAALLKQPGIKKLFDDGTLSGAKGDIDAGKDVEQAIKDGKDTQVAPKPVAPPNSTTEGAPSAATADEAIAKANAQSKDGTPTQPKKKKKKKAD